MNCSKKILGSVVIVLVISIVGTLTFTRNYSAKIYDSPEAARDLFFNDKESFEEIAYILFENDELRDYLHEIDRKGIFGPDIPQRQEYLTHEEYKQICVFLNQYQPYQIGLEFGYVSFVFLCKNHDVDLYYIDQTCKELSYTLAYLGQHYDVVEVADNWYIRVHPSDVTRE